MERFDKLRHHWMWNHDSLGDAMRPANRLQKIDDKLVGSCHYNRSGAEATITNVIWHSSSQRGVVVATRIGTVLGRRFGIGGHTSAIRWRNRSYGMGEKQASDTFYSLET